jgi:hypothetical protein
MMRRLLGLIIFAILGYTFDAIAQDNIKVHQFSCGECAHTDTTTKTAACWDYDIKTIEPATGQGKAIISINGFQTEDNFEALTAAASGPGLDVFILPEKLPPVTLFTLIPSDKKTKKYYLVFAGITSNIHSTKISCTESPQAPNAH